MAEVIVSVNAESELYNKQYVLDEEATMYMIYLNDKKILKFSLANMASIAVVLSQFEKFMTHYHDGVLTLNSMILKFTAPKIVKILSLFKPIKTVKWYTTKFYDTYMSRLEIHEHTMPVDEFVDQRIIGEVTSVEMFEIFKSVTKKNKSIYDYNYIYNYDRYY